jgi:hypothetical protein
MSHYMWKLEVSAVGGDYHIVDAYKHGKFMVHLPVGQSFSDNPDYAPDALWVISHRATGRVVMSAWGRANARRLARKLDTATTTDITREDYTNKTEAWRVFTKALAAIVKRDKEPSDVE